MPDRKHPPGTRLGPYEVIEPLGAGGMGEVYRARDTRLGREVAVKVLTEHLARDPSALARFTREARLVAALSHPNLCGLHDVGEERGIAYAVMELLEGETLGKRLKKGRLSPRGAVEIGVAVALGLAAAHDKGIVHRDLKPENVFLLHDGRVKVLDFGLARDTFGGMFQKVDDRTDAVTREGIVVGTVGYMSPEQVEGEAVDHRSDVFSLGCVLYEMLGGVRAFERSSPIATMKAILDEETVPLSERNPALPASLARVVERCLEKRPERRFQSTHDLAFALKAAGVDASAAPPAPPAGSDPSTAPEAARSSVATATSPTLAVPRRRASRGPLVAGVAALLAAAVSGWLARGLGRVDRVDRPPAGRVTPLTDLPGVEQSPRLSPDGRSVAFVSRISGNADVYVQRVGGHNPIDLTRDCDRDDTGPAFSADGERIAFRSECDGGGIFVMGATGESRRRVTPSGYDPSFSPDGRSIVVASEPTASPLSRFSPSSRLSVVDVASGAKRDLTDQDGMQPAWSPRGTRIAFWGLRGPASRTGQRDLFTVAATGGTPAEVTNDAAVDWAPAWSADGRFLYFASDRGGTMNIWRVGIDEATGALRGEAEPITMPALSASSPSLSRSGQLAFAAQEERSVLYRVAFDPARGEPAGEPAAVLSGSRTINHVALSADGTAAAFTGGALASHEKLYAIRTDGSGYRQLLDDDFRNRVPRWSPDGARLAFFSNRGGAYEIWTLGADGSGLARFASEAGDSLFYPAFSRDGGRLSANDYASTRLYPVGGSGPVTSLPPLGGGQTFFAVDWAPGGERLLGFGIRPDGIADGTFTYDLAGGRYERVADGSSRWMLWLPDGNRFLQAMSDGSLRQASAAGRGTRTLFPPGTLAGDVGTFDLSRDGRLLVYARTTREADLWMLTPRDVDPRRAAARRP